MSIAESETFDIRWVSRNTTTYPPYINCDIVIAHIGDDPPKDSKTFVLC